MPKVHGYNCSAYGCLSRQFDKDGKSFFSFPRDPERLKAWLQALNRNDLAESFARGKVNYRVCSDHFNPNDFHYRRLLMDSAVPNLSPKEEINLSKQKQTQTKEYCSAATQTEDFTAKSDFTAQTSTTVTVNSPRKRKLKGLVQEANKRMKIIKKDSIMTKEKFLDYCDQFLDPNASKFVKCQLMLKNKAKTNRYTLDFKVFCLNLYFCSPQSYTFLNNCFYLPSVRTLQWMQLPITTGLNKHFLNALKQKVSTMSDKEKICSLCIDGMSLKANLFYDIGQDKIHGVHEINQITKPIPAKNAVVLMIQGLFVKWKQPLAYALLAESKNYSELSAWVDYVISILLDIGLDVRALISDLGSDFVNAAKSRNVSPESTYFFISNKKNYYIFDAPHLIKCVRNNLMKYDFHFGDKIAKWEHIQL